MGASPPGETQARLGTSSGERRRSRFVVLLDKHRAACHPRRKRLQVALALRPSKGTSLPEGKPWPAGALRCVMGLILVALVWPIASCGFLRAAPGTSAGPTPPPTAIRGALPDIAPGTPTSEITLYFPRLLEDETLGLSATRRVVPSHDLLRMAIEALIQGPDGDERAADYAYPLSPRTRVISLRVDDGVARIEFDREVDRVRGRPFSELAYWSIVYTLTEVPGVRAVTLLRDAEPLREFGFPAFRIPEIGTRTDAPSWAHPR